MHAFKQLLSLSLFIPFLAGCFGESACPDYRQLPELDRNQDGKIDYRIQFIGDSIIAYHDTFCKGVGHNIGFALGEKIKTRAVIGAKVREIGEQFEVAADPESDYSLVVINGGLNDLIADQNPNNPQGEACDCNGNLNHQACLDEIDAVSNRMSDVIARVESLSNAEVALVGYYPAEQAESFIGQCFPYLETMHARYQAMADSNPRLSFVVTHGHDAPVIGKVSQLGYDNYHPTPEGSKAIADLIYAELGLDRLIIQEP